VIDARAKVQAAFWQAEGDGRSGADGVAQHGAAVRMNPGRDINGDDGLA
jgi:hypothetical protein